MDRSTITKRLQQIIERYLPPETDAGAIREDVHLLTDLSINSANLVDIILDVEDEFDITINDEAAEKMTTVKSALDEIEKALAQS